MRLVTAFALLVVVALSPLSIGQDRALAFSALAFSAQYLAARPLPGATDVQRAKIVCGDTPEGYRCRSEGGAIRRGKMPKIPDSGPSAPSDGTSGNAPWGGGGLWGGGSLWGGNKDEAPAAAPSAGSGGERRAAAGGCPANTERLGGHCIPYKQTCTRGLAANAAPQVCRSAQEKLVCEFRADGLKDCCCRIYSQN
ncbi:hypothetical protein AUC68_07970 [Methyloceanibacter methanicus]|uniref:Uncharacterized protein n=1 Tax=Methyloceanibacter methanicus TaxID=1774968 RepID=A0A1E3VXX2_9HYPH|nr:hypothetical protein [Methyloceanibacter methanicus]ODR98372.1 hypothetical protein AUC68_07970 [Methyloceanibacter methanicus]